ncbi:MAG: BACON domain-containing protein [Candidatus Aminicenantes bacterium]|nr:BACON domain-containing protein [Candidatus Aminicenantes bacterium]
MGSGNFKIISILNKKIIFFLIFLAVVHFSLFGGAINLSKTSNQSLWPAVEVNSKGEVMVVWTELEGKGNIYYTIYKNGAWTAVRYAGIVRENSWSNQLAVDSYDVFHLSYADGFGSLGRDIYYSYYTGNNWASPERVYSSPHNSAWNRMDIEGNNIYIIWYHKYLDGGNISDVVAMSKERMGAWPINYENISRHPSLESIHPDICVKSGNLYATYMEGGVVPGDWKLYFCEKSGGSWKTPLVLAQPGYYPAIAVDGPGNIHIAYSNRSGNFFSVSRTDGNWTPITVISSNYAPLQFGYIKRKGSIIVATWVQSDGGNYSPFYAMKISGSKWTIPIKIADGGALDNKHVQVALDGQGYAHFIWEDGGVGGNVDVFYQKVFLADLDRPFIEVDKFYLEFTTKEFKNPDPQIFRIRNVGKDTLDYAISSNRSWINVYPEAGTSSGEWDDISVGLDVANLKSGKYKGVVTVNSSNAFNSPVEIEISLCIEEPESPNILLNKSSLSFSAYAAGENPPSQTFEIRNGGINTLNYEISSNRNWIEVSPKKGSSSGEWDAITVAVDTFSLGVGHYTGVIEITGNAGNSPQKITVDLEVILPPYPYPPTNVQVEKISHEGLMLRIYKNEISWEKNLKNKGLFMIEKYRIYRKEKTESISAYIKVGEVNADTFIFYDGDFSSIKERDQYSYSVTSVDVNNNESQKAETFRIERVPLTVNPKKTVENRK